LATPMPCSTWDPITATTCRKLHRFADLLFDRTAADPRLRRRNRLHRYGLAKWLPRCRLCVSLVRISPATGASCRPRVMPLCILLDMLDWPEAGPQRCRPMRLGHAR
jgi:hypothetical protein